MLVYGSEMCPLWTLADNVFMFLELLLFYPVSEAHQENYDVILDK